MAKFLIGLLTGAILTVLNKLIFPILWFGVIGGLLIWVYLTAGPISIPTLVARTTRSRFPVRLSHRPRTVSDSPPWLPGTHRE